MSASDARKELEAATIPNPSDWSRSQADSLTYIWRKHISNPEDYPFEGARDYEGDEDLVVTVQLQWYDAWGVELLVHEHPDELLAPYTSETEVDMPSLDAALSRVSELLDKY